jgi:hypothetical protein
VKDTGRDSHNSNIVEDLRYSQEHGFLSLFLFLTSSFHSLGSNWSLPELVCPAIWDWARTEISGRVQLRVCVYVCVLREHQRCFRPNRVPMGNGWPAQRTDRCVHRNFTCIISQLEAYMIIISTVVCAGRSSHITIVAYTPIYFDLSPEPVTFASSNIDDSAVHYFIKPWSYKAHWLVCEPSDLISTF